MNPFSTTLDTVAAEIQLAVPDYLVTRDPSVIAARVNQSGIAVLVGPGVVTEASSYVSWFLDIPVHVVFGNPADPRLLDPAYDVAHQIMTSDAGQFVSMDPRTIQLDSATALPAITVTLRTSTEC